MQPIARAGTVAVTPLESQATEEALNARYRTHSHASGPRRAVEDHRQQQQPVVRPDKGSLIVAHPRRLTTNQDHRETKKREIAVLLGFERTICSLDAYTKKSDEVLPLPRRNSTKTRSESEEIAEIQQPEAHNVLESRKTQIMSIEVG